MSTKERFGSLVWDAVCQISQSSTPFMTVGEVAAAAQVSRPTAKKYLDALVEKEHMTIWKANATHSFYVMTGV